MPYIILLIVFIADRVTKFFAEKHLAGGKKITVINNFLNFEYVQNKGAAFGILQDQRLFFLIITTITLGALYYLIKHYSLHLSKFDRAFLSLFIAGTVGNLWDRIFYGYVVDFISFNIGSYHFPVFNIADMAITLSVIYFIIFRLIKEI